jgi:uncharacterized protein (TIGR02679 family)
MVGNAMTDSSQQAPATQPPDMERLRRLLGKPELGWLVDRVRRRIARREPLTGTLTLAAATEPQRHALNQLLGRIHRPGTAVTVSLDAVDQLMRASGAHPAGLGAAVVALTGPVPDLMAAQADERNAWDRAFAPLVAVVEAQPKYQAWYAAVRSSGLVRRLAGTPDAATQLLSDAATVLASLPAAGEPVGVVAARLLGDAHALDDDRPVTTLVLGAARCLGDVPDGTNAEWRREVWASVGLLRDELSSTVLTLGLPGDQQSSTGRALAACQQAGQPMVITLRQLVRDPPIAAGGRYFACENPAVVSVAAERFGASCPPLVCVRGQPSAAVVHLLRQLTNAGATIQYHGDFDWGGLRIANHLIDRFPVHPWRFGTDDYRAAGSGHTLTGRPTAASWDPDLAPVMRERGIAVEEELVIEHLMADLAEVATNTGGDRG